MRLSCIIALLALPWSFFAQAPSPSPILATPMPVQKSAPQLIVIDPANGIQPPQFMEYNPPDFSQCHDTKRHQLVLTLKVDKTGRPQDVDFIVTGIEKCLSKAATAAVKQYRFEPAQKDGRPISASIALRFALDSSVPTDSPPFLIRSAEPEFPFHGIGIHAFVRITMKIDRDGIPHNLRIVSTTDPRFNANAMTAASKYLFWPAEKNGQPVAVELSIDIRFDS
jgi:TonB family protein